MVRREFIFLTILVVFLDQFSKYLVSFFRPDFGSDFFKVHYLTNTGAGWGILPGKSLWLGFISLAVAIFIVYNYQKLPTERFPQLLYALFLGGVIGNGIDRFFRGFVVDFIDFSFWPAFNIADAAISIAVVGLLYWYWFVEK